MSTWFYQSKSQQTEFAQEILKCTSDGITFNENEARQRSPVFWNMPAIPNGKLEIFAGINDGWQGGVPICHSIRFFNKVAAHYGYSKCCVSTLDIIKLLSRGIEGPGHYKKMQGRLVLYEKKTPLVSLTIFDGCHEMLSKYCFERLKEIAEGGYTEK